MNLFTNSIESRRLHTILSTQLKVKDIDIVVFKDVPGMTWLNFTFNNIKFNLIHHHLSEKYSFKGSSIELKLDTLSRVSYKEELHEETFKKIMKCLAMSLGGIVGELPGDEFLEGYDHPGTESSNFLLNELFQHGVDDEVVSNALETLLEKQKASKNSNC